jgi:hypothetical protein
MAFAGCNELQPSLRVLPIIFGLLRSYFYFEYHRLSGDRQNIGEGFLRLKKR